jgi:hypothetical protein
LVRGDWSPWTEKKCDTDKQISAYQGPRAMALKITPCEPIDDWRIITLEYQNTI